ncbi:MAG: DMT family transporter [Deltaproteobacteria bacterium]|nr:DMT family transporter [Deltaproteobacteria bacterium]
MNSTGIEHSIPFLGEGLSLASALIWAAAVILFKKTGEQVQPFELNLFKTVVSFVFLVLTALVIGLDPAPKGTGPMDWIMLMSAGFIGVAVSDTLFFISLNKLGAGLTAVLDCLYSPSVVILSFFFLGERIGPAGYIGAGLISVAILVGSAGGALPGTTRRDLFLGLAAGTLGILGMGIGIVMTKEILDRSPLFWTIVVRHSGGVLGLILLAPIFSGKKRSAFRVFIPAKIWKVMVPAALLGNYIAMMTWLGGMKYTYASVAAILNQLSSILIFLLAAIFLKEPLTPRRTAAVLIAVLGAMMTAARGYLW